MWGSEKSIRGSPCPLPTPLQERHPRTNRRTLIDPIPTVLSQVTAACPVFPQGVRTYRLFQLPDNSG